MKRSIKLTGIFLCFSSKYWHSPNSENMICHHPINMSHCATSNHVKCKSEKVGLAHGSPLLGKWLLTVRGAKEENAEKKGI